MIIQPAEYLKHIFHTLVFLRVFQDVVHHLRSGY
jgi:hypothetical protein